MKQSVFLILFFSFASIVQARCHHYCQINNGGKCRCDGEQGMIVNFKSSMMGCEYTCYVNKMHHCERHCPPM